MIRLIFILSLMATAVFADTIHYQKGGVRSKVTVIKDTWKEVMYSADSGVPVRIATELVKRIDYSDAPPAYIDAKNAMNRGLYQDAARWFAEALETAKQPPVVREWINQYGNYYLAKAYHEWGNNSFDNEKYRQAISYYRKTLQVAPQTRFLFSCHFGLAQCYLKLQQYSQAAQSLERLKNSLGSRPNPTWLVNATIWQGRVALEQQQYSLALEHYRRAEKLAQEKQLPLLRNDAILQTGECYIAQKQFTKAEDYFKNIPQQRDNPSLAAVVANGLALCYLKQGRIDRARELAITIILKYPEAGKQQASAFFIAGRCYEQLADKEKDSLQRAKVYYQLLKIGHSNSEWGMKAIRRLQKLELQKR